ncbi:branched-chain amino acid ABC transporter permease [Bradyrhizobium sp. Arg237L]|uniref:branched-chain amino acid ABC transporter permease n=1 Tax=Bradyrhizobium sp. Arg237L TaxID=3003352 RepID=UPI00249EE7BB|nr:branched-chain amino acid ABC transporter permease [Bradyrhizobium sp. Arg237L]MDI4238303.1 branched-chain amino acid ABC transporter permease [Bradyrhizobium sp. Arg237L]
MLGFQILNGLVYSGILFTMALGFSIVFGVMKLTHFGHAAFFMLGAFLTHQALAWWGSFTLAIVLVPVTVGLVALAVEKTLIRRVYAASHLDQVILTIGIGYVIADIVLAIWGGDIRQIAEPEALSGVLFIGVQPVPIYRLFVVGFAVCSAGATYWLFERTRFGHMLQASTEDAAMADAIGIDTSRLFTIVFVASTAFTGLAAVVAGPITQASIGMDHENLLLSLIVVIIGGVGTIGGVLVGALALGVGDTLSKVFFPSYSEVFSYGLMMFVLIARPQGLVGTRVLQRV